MKTRYRLIRRSIRGNRFYCVDKTTGKRTSLHTAKAVHRAYAKRALMKIPSLEEYEQNAG